MAGRTAVALPVVCLGEVPVAPAEGASPAAGAKPSPRASGETRQPGLCGHAVGEARSRLRQQALPPISRALSTAEGVRGAAGETVAHKMAEPGGVWEGRAAGAIFFARGRWPRRRGSGLGLCHCRRPARSHHVELARASAPAAHGPRAARLLGPLPGACAAWRLPGKSGRAEALLAGLLDEDGYPRGGRCSYPA